MKNGIADDDAFHDQHCLSCYNIKKCAKVGSSCPIISCPLDCGSKFHKCKLEEHKLLCSDIKVPCLNVEYGCPCSMPRKLLSPHLAKCPAGGISCSMQWRRYRSPRFEKTYRHHYGKTNLPFQFAFTLADMRQFPASNENELEELENSNHGKVKIPHLFNEQEARKMTKDDIVPVIYTEHGIPIDDYVSDGFVSIKDHAEYLGNLNVSCNQYNSAGKIVLGKSRLSKKSVYARECIDISQYPTRFLGLGIHDLDKDFHVSHCAQVFRRDQYSSHYKNVHCDIQQGLNGSLIRQCPLAQYGCPYSELRLVPKPQGSRIIYSKHLKSFGIEPMPNVWANKDSVDQISSVSQNDTSSLCDLPIELWYYVASYLDNFSLSNLAATSKQMRQLCYSLVTRHGIVNLHWQKQNGSWKVVHKKWSFSSCFSAIEEWNFGNLGAMSNHLKSCLYYTRVKLKYPLRIIGDSYSYNYLIEKLNVNEGKVHNHCMNCFNLEQCSARPFEGIGCEIVSCIFQCGFRFHSCKSVEHQELCQNKRVACINASYGCPFIMPRKMLGSHLATCPASCVLCKWWVNSWFQLQSGLDVIRNLMTKKQQIQIQLLLDPVTVPVIVVSKAFSSWKDAEAMAFKILISPNCYGVASQGFQEHHVTACALMVTDTPCTDCDEPMRVPEENLNLEQIRNLSFQCSSYGTKGGSEKRLRMHSRFGTEWTIINCDSSIWNSRYEYQPIEINKERQYIKFHFRCNEVFRRDEYPLHYKYVHSEELTKNHIFCPFVQFGCKFSTLLFDTSPKTTEVEEECSRREFDLTELPMKVILHISQFLDGVSLRALSLTSKKIRNLCQSLVAERGMVVFRWKKRKNSNAISWRAEKCWSFSKHSAMSVTWAFDHVEKMSAHLKTCPFFIKTEPIPIPSHCLVQ